MNKKRRKCIDSVILKINNLQDIIEELQQDIEDIAADEQDYLDNIPENLQGSERYEAGEEAVENLEAAIDWLDDIKTSAVRCKRLISKSCKVFGKSENIIVSQGTLQQSVVYPGKKRIGGKGY